jgi:hypothetical protein
VSTTLSPPFCLDAARRMGLLNDVGDAPRARRMTGAPDGASGARRRRVLFVTYFFPPVANSGTFRPMKFARYLRRVAPLGAVARARPSEPRFWT